MQALGQPVDLIRHGVEVEARAVGRRDAELAHQRLAAVMPGADRDRLHVEDLRDVVRMGTAARAMKLIRREGKESILGRAIGNDFKGKISPVLYITAAGLAFFKPWLSCVIYAFVALMWLVPDRRIEKMLSR